METKKNDKYKKKYILKQVEDKWGYYEFEGNIVIVKNCILNKKYNKIYQLIFHGGESIDGLYWINSFDVSIHYEEDNEKVITIVNKKYDKIAGYDDCTVNCFETKDKFINWLIEEKFITEDEVEFIKNEGINKKHLKGMPRFILDS